MPEGPSLVILKEAVTPFVGKKIIEARGNAKINMDGCTKKRSWTFGPGESNFLFAWKMQPSASIF